MTKSLSKEDVAKLASGKGDPGVRVETLEKVAGCFIDGALTPAERVLAEDIFRAMAGDVEVRVRQALSDSLRLCPDIPRDLAQQIASDISDVAVPFIEMTEALTDEDLIEIIRTQGEQHQVAVARRPSVSEVVSDALVDTRNEEVVATLVQNEGAEISENTMTRVLDDFGHVKSISVPMAERKALPLSIAERLVSLVSDKMQSKLEDVSGIDGKIARTLSQDSREKATVSLLDGEYDSPDIHALVEQLHRSDRLTHSLVVRALCMGDMVFFEAGMAKLANIPVVNVYKLVHQKGARGLERLFEKIGMDQLLLDVSLIALSLAQEMGLDSRDDRDHFRSIMIERVLTQLGDTHDPDDLEFLLSRISTKRAA